MIEVFWSCIEPEYLRAKEPEPVFHTADKNMLQSSDLIKCPAFKDFYKNCFGLKSIYDYEFSFDDTQIHSDLYDQNFYNHHVVARNLENKMFSFLNRYIFFTKEKTLEVSFEPPLFENNYISKNITPIPGKFDIAKWYRPTEFAFFVNKNIDCFKISEGDIYYYIRFHTKEKIKFTQFIENEALAKYRNDVLNSRNNKIGSKNLSYYYNNFNLKKNILSEIKRGLV